jgi:hypothetical protein
MNLKGRIFSYLPPSVRSSVLRRLKRFEPWQAGFDFTPPDRHTGEDIGPPDFVGIGVGDCGTEWWHDLILLHPGVSLPAGRHKDLHFFDRFGGEYFGRAMIDWYHGWFPRRPGALVGEWSPDYFGYLWVPKLLHEAAPHARLILMLRDPVERMRASIDWHLRTHRPIAASVLAEAVNLGFYNGTLEHWYEFFASSQVLVLQYERCITDIEGQLKLTYDYLGLTEYHSSETERPRNPAARESESKQRGHLDAEVKKRLVELYSPDMAALSRKLPHLDLSLWPNFAHLAYGGNSLAPANRAATQTSLN